MTSSRRNVSAESILSPNIANSFALNISTNVSRNLNPLKIGINQLLQSSQRKPPYQKRYAGRTRVLNSSTPLSNQLHRLSRLLQVVTCGGFVALLDQKLSLAPSRPKNYFRFTLTVSSPTSNTPHSPVRIIVRAAQSWSRILRRCNCASHNTVLEGVHDF